MMVSTTDNQNSDLCSDSNRSNLVQSAISHSAIDLEIIGEQTSPVNNKNLIDCELARKALKLDFTHREEKGSIDTEDEKSGNSTTLSKADLKSPKSPLSNSSAFVL